MKPTPFSWLAGVAALLLWPTMLSAQTVPPDKPGCKDSSLLSRVSGCYIDACERNDWDALQVAVALRKMQAVEGAIEKLTYYCPVDYSRLKVVRNAEGALKAAGYTIVYAGDYDGDPAVTARKGPQWVFVSTGTGRYWVRTVKAKEMVQEMKAGAEEWNSAISQTGHAAVYGIYFDTGKADVKPESEPAIAEILKLLRQDPALRIHVVGHTDNVGPLPANMDLSRRRATAIVAVLTEKHGIASDRLRPEGVGPLAPVASNATEEGRAKNRRVELVRF
jgi:OmpA-OmpF porin, OOP family